MTSGGVSFDPGQTSSSRFSDQAYNPTGYKVTGWEYTISTNLDQMDIWNLALSLSYPQDDVGSSSSVILSGTLGPPPYKCVELTTEGPASTADLQGTKSLIIALFRCRIVSGGAISFDRDTPANSPIVIHACANGADVAGYVATTDHAMAPPGYES